MIEIILQYIVNHTANEGDIRTRPDFGVDVCLGGRTGKPRVNADEFGAVLHSLSYPPEGYNVILSSVRADNHNTIAVFKVNKVIGHCASTERLCQSRYCRGMSYTGLVFYINETEGPHCLAEEVALFIVQSCAAQVPNGFRSVN